MQNNNGHIILCGCGNMAKTLEKVAHSQNFHVTQFDNDFSHTCMERYGRAVAINFGSGRQLPMLADFCEEQKVPLIQGSTRGGKPANKNLVVLNAPNLSLPIVRFMRSFKRFASEIGEDMNFSILESHQSKKTDVSGTARAIAKDMNMSEDYIYSVRLPTAQQAMGVPQEFLDGHAYHSFIFTGLGVEISLNTKIHGRDTYAYGALMVVKKLLKFFEDNNYYEYNGVWELKDRFGSVPMPLFK